MEDRKVVEEIDGLIDDMGDKREEEEDESNKFAPLSLLMKIIANTEARNNRNLRYGPTFFCVDLRSVVPYSRHLCVCVSFSNFQEFVHHFRVRHRQQASAKGASRKPISGGHPKESNI